MLICHLDVVELDSLRDLLLLVLVLGDLVSVVRRPLGALHQDLQWTYLERDNLNMLISDLEDELDVEVTVEPACSIAC